MLLFTSRKFIRACRVLWGFHILRNVAEGFVIPLRCCIFIEKSLHFLASVNE